MAAKHPHILRTTCTATALSVMLAACGGGGGSERDKAVSASPVAPAPTQNIVATAPTTPSVTTPQSNPVPTGQVNTPANGPSTSVQPAPVAPQTPSASQNQTTTLPPTTLAPTQPVAQADTKPAPTPAPTPTPTPIPTPTPAPTPEPKTVPNISSKGVRGDVLLAMIEQNRCRTSTYSATSYDGPEIKDRQAIGIANVRMYAWLDAHNNVSDPNYDAPIALAPDQHRCGKRYYHPVSTGTYEYEVSSKADYIQYRQSPLYGEPWLKRGFNSLKVSYTINITPDRVEVGPYIKVRIEEDLGYLAERYSGSGPKGKVEDPWFRSTGLQTNFKRDQVVPFGTLQEWTNSHDIVRLMLIKGTKKDEAKLCTNVELSFVRRLQCTVWHIPADWKWGQELQTPEGYIVDDRSAYPNESGLLYWRTAD